MFTQLVESGAKAKRGFSGTAMSFVLHYGLILAVIFTSAQAAVVESGPKAEKVQFVEPENVEQPEPKPVAPELMAAPLPTRLPPTLVMPVEVPSALPEIDLSKAPTDASVFDGRRGPVRMPAGDSSVTAAPAADHAYFDFQVEKPVVQAPNSAMPAYPDILRQAGVEGDALVSFVVDTLGRVDLPTFKVIRASHDLFASAVRNALPRLRFLPAERSSGKVRQLVQQPFTFSIVK